MSSKLKVLIILVALLLGGLLLVSCQADDAAAPEPEEETAPVDETTWPQPSGEPWPSLVGFLVTGEGHTSYAVALAVNALITEHVDGVTARELVIESPPAGLRRMGGGEGPLVYAPSGITYLTNRGIGDFELIPVNLLWGGDRVFQHLVVLKDSGIDSFGDLAGKKIVAEMPPAPGHVASFLGALEAYGLTENDLTILAGMSFSEMIQPVVEGMADGVHLAGGFGMGALRELMILRDVKLISIDPEKMPAALEGAAKRNWFFNHQILPAGSYDGQDYDVHCTGSFASYGVSPTACPELVYQIMKAIFDHEDQLNEQLPPGVFEMRANTVLVDFTSPYHPGAIRYYRERGVWTEEHDKLQQELLDELGSDLFAPYGFEPMN